MLDMVSILSSDNLLKDQQIAALQKQLDEAMGMIVDLLRAGGDDTPGCSCPWCLIMSEARDLLDQRAVAQALVLLEGSSNE